MTGRVARRRCLSRRWSGGVSQKPPPPRPSEHPESPLSSPSDTLWVFQWRRAGVLYPACTTLPRYTRVHHPGYTTVHQHTCTHAVRHRCTALVVEREIGLWARIFRHFLTESSLSSLSALSCQERSKESSGKPRKPRSRTGERLDRDRVIPPIITLETDCCGRRVTTLGSRRAITRD